MLGGRKSIANGLAFADAPHGTGGDGQGPSDTAPGTEKPEKPQREKKALTVVKVVAQKIKLVSSKLTELKVMNNKVENSPLFLDLYKGKSCLWSSVPTPLYIITGTYFTGIIEGFWSLL